MFRIRAIYLFKKTLNKRGASHELSGCRFKRDVYILDVYILDEDLELYYYFEFESYDESLCLNNDSGLR